MPEYCSIVWKYIIIFSQVVGHLDCFQFLAIMSNPAENICVHVFVGTYIVSLDRFSGEGVLSHDQDTV